MKKIFILWCLIIIHTSIYAQIKSVSVQASGLTCSMCSNAIYKALKTLPFVSNVKSDIETSSFQISFLPNKQIDFDAIQQKIVGAGFFVSSFKPIIQFNHLNIENDSHANINNMNFHFVEVKKQVLNSEYEFLLIDKNFISDKQFKTYKTSTQMSCLETGKKTASCDANLKDNGSNRMYHLTLISI